MMINLYAILKRKKKLKIFNNYFAQQCSVINNNSIVPERILYRTDASLAKVVLTTYNIANIIKKSRFKQIS